MNAQAGDRGAGKQSGTGRGRKAGAGRQAGLGNADGRQASVLDDGFLRQLRGLLDFLSRKPAAPEQPCVVSASASTAPSMSLRYRH